MTARGGVRLFAIALIVLVLLPSCATTPPPRPVRVEPVAQAPKNEGRLKRSVLNLAMRAYQCGVREGRITRPVLSIIDYSLPAHLPRLWVIDVEARRVLHHELVAHGERSGGHMAVSFSNEIGSHQSSIGLFRTDEVYYGRFGYSLRLSGLEPGVNDNARERAIVMHGLDGVGRSAVADTGTIGQSWGCPAVPPEVSADIIDTISYGSAIFAYYPDAEWLRDSHFLNCDLQLADADTAN